VIPRSHAVAGIVHQVSMVTLLLQRTTGLTEAPTGKLCLPALNTRIAAI